MRLHKALNIPELVYPAPFACDPSYRDTSVCVYTSRGSHQLRVASWLIIGVAIFGLAMAILTTLQGNLTTPVNSNYRGIHLPPWAMYPLGIALFFGGLISLRLSNHRSQLLVDRHTKRAQIQYTTGTRSDSPEASITLTQSTLVTGSVMGTRNKSVETKQGQFTIVAIDVAHDCYILGAFKSYEVAIEYAQEASQLTGLPISDRHNEELLRTAGERMYLFHSSDKHALRKRKRTKPMQPVQFL